MDPENPDVCYNGLFTVLSFDFSALNVTLPDDVVVGVALNSSGAGYEPITGPVDNTALEPYNLLNVAIGGDVPAAIGTGENAFYLASGAAPVLGGPSAWGVDPYAIQLTVFVKPAVVPVVPAGPTIPPTGMPVEGALLAGLGLLALGGVFAALTVARRKDAAAQ
jgi:hypothetical protein